MSVIWGKQGHVAIIKPIKVPYPSNTAKLTYTGEALSPMWTNYDESKLNIAGDISAVNAGTYTAKFTPKNGYCWEDETTITKSIEWSIAKKKVNAYITPTSMTINSLSDFPATCTITVVHSGNNNDIKWSLHYSYTGVTGITKSGNKITVRLTGIPSTAGDTFTGYNLWIWCEDSINYDYTMTQTGYTESLFKIKYAKPVGELT